MYFYQDITYTIDLPTFRGVTFSYGFCTQKLNKMNKKQFFIYFKTSFITPNKFYINIFHRTLRKNSRNGLFLTFKVE